MTLEGIYIWVYSNHTVVLDKKTGTVAGNIAMALSGRLWVTDNLFFSLEGTTLYAIDQNSLLKTLIDTSVYTVARVGANIQYITETNSGVVKNTLDIANLTVCRELLIDTNNGLGSAYDYIPACIDSAGKIVFFKNKGAGTDQFCGIRVYSSANKILSQIPLTVGSNYGLPSVYTPFDEYGECHQVIAWFVDSSSRPRANAFIGFNLDNSSLAGYDIRSSEISGGFTAFESNGITHMYGPGYYLNGQSGYFGYAFNITYNGSTIKGNWGGIINGQDEAYTVSDRIIASYFGDNSSVATLKLQISAFPKSLIQETKELLGKFSNKFTFVGNVSTTADQIKASVEAAKPAVKVTAAQDGYLSMPGVKLIPNKTYYYDYDMKALAAGTESKLNGLTATNNIASTAQPLLSDRYYVEKSYVEDFSDDKYNSFFTVASGTLAEGMFGAYSQKDCKGGTVTFTVPTGKLAVLSFDYLLNMKVKNWRASVYIDGERMYEDLPTTNDVDYPGHYTHYKFLQPGTHTIGCNISINSYDQWSKILIDNLKVDIVSPTEPVLKNTSYAQNENGWIGQSGSFETPNRTISYGAQASSYWSGNLGITNAGTDYSTSWRYYGLTVPAGYLVRGWGYPTGAFFRSNTFTLTLGKYAYVVGGGTVPSVSFGEKIFLGTLSPGTYSPSMTWGDDRASGYISPFHFIYYPMNDATATGDIIFNDDYSRCFFQNKTWDGTTNLSIYIPKGEYLIKNLRIYYMENGQKVYLQNKALDDTSELPNWALSPGLTASNATNIEKKEDDEYVKIYKKGERVLYNIFYDDYEKDPSKTGYWVYTHVPWPPDTLHPDIGKVLTAPIDRFYLSGKYTVTHWEVDNTQRPGTVGDAAPFNKESNKVTMTFYVNGDGESAMDHIHKNKSVKSKGKQ